MKVIVTGGAGFIGSNLVDTLIEKGHEVTIIDDLSTGKLENINPKAKFLQLDLSQLDVDITDVFKGMDCVFHLAAWARVPRSIEDPVGTNKVNVGGTLNVLQACRMAKVPRLVYSSSSSVYGDQDTYLMKEGMTLAPKSPYGLQKLVGEMYCKMFSRLFGMQIFGLRYFNVYGNRQVLEGAYSLVIGKFMKQKGEGKKMTIYGDGTQTRAYTHVSDVVQANLLAWEYRSDVPFFYPLNIGTGEETSVNEIAGMLGGESEHIIPNPRGEYEEMRKAADVLEANALIHWEPKIFIKEGISMLLK